MPTADEARRAATAAQQRADELKARAERMHESAHGMYGRFAGGQPLLVDHHSYRSAVRDRGRGDSATGRAVEASKEAEDAHRKANKLANEADIAERLNARGREWCPSDFKRGDVVTVRISHASEATYRVKRVNAKTLTLDGGGGGMDDPKREYARVMSRTRAGTTITDPAQAED